MPKCLPLIMFLATCLLGHAREIRYAYDACGNRVKREIVMDGSLKSRQKAPDTGSEYYDTVGDKAVKLSYTPDGIINLEFIDFNESDCYAVSVHSAAGLPILNIEAEEPVNVMDISSRQQGLYILTVTINDSRITWKISKR